MVTDIKPAGIPTTHGSGRATRYVDRCRANKKAVVALPIVSPSVLHEEGFVFVLFEPAGSGGIHPR